MPIDVTAETTIARSPADVAGFAMDPTNDTRWIGGITEARVLTDPPFGRGAKVERVARFLGRRIEYVNEVTGYEPPRRLEMRSVRGPFPMRITYGFEPDATGAKASVRVEGDASGFYRLAAPPFAAQVRRSVRGDLRTLKTLLEES